MFYRSSMNSWCFWRMMPNQWILNGWSSTSWRSRWQVHWTKMKQAIWFKSLHNEEMKTIMLLALEVYKRFIHYKIVIINSDWRHWTSATYHIISYAGLKWNNDLFYPVVEYVVLLSMILAWWSSSEKAQL